MNKLILTLTAFASVGMPVIAGEPIGSVLANGDDWKIRMLTSNVTPEPAK
jgi:hypothetical protein